jgi:hypothetical protein
VEAKRQNEARYEDEAADEDKDKVGDVIKKKTRRRRRKARKNRLMTHLVSSNTEIDIGKVAFEL